MALWLGPMASIATPFHASTNSPSTEYFPVASVQVWTFRGGTSGASDAAITPAALLSGVDLSTDCVSAAGAAVNAETTPAFCGVDGPVLTGGRVACSVIGPTGSGAGNGGDACRLGLCLAGLLS